MQRKITDVFKNFLMPRQEGDEEEYEALLQSQLEATQKQSEVRESYKNLKWTRVLSLEGWENNSTGVYDLGPDIIAELESMEDIQSQELPKLEPVFDPITF